FVAQAEGQMHRVNDSVQLSIYAEDPLGGVLHFSAFGLPPGLSIDSNSGVITGRVLPTTMLQYQALVSVKSAIGAEVTTKFLWEIKPGALRWRLNSGGDLVEPEDHDIDAVLWEADNQTTPHRHVLPLGGLSVNGGAMPALHSQAPTWYPRTVLWDFWYDTRAPFLTYTLPVSGASKYLVLLGFNETSVEAPGLRQFDLLINMQPVLIKFDIFAEAGGKDIGLVKQFIVTPVNHQIEITFRRNDGAPRISSIEVYDIATAAPPPPPPELPIPLANFLVHSEDLRSFTFVDVSTPAESLTSWQWQFGTLGSSSERQPSFSFDHDGQIDVTLTVSNRTGTASITKSIQVTGNPEHNPPEAQFAFTSQNHITFAFIDQSTSPVAITAWQWDFGDGSAGSDLPSPTHTFAQNGDYTVTLEVASAVGVSSPFAQLITVTGIAAPPPPPEDENTGGGVPPSEDTTQEVIALGSGAYMTFDLLPMLYSDPMWGDDALDSVFDLGDDTL
ncbi:MAG: PKD domain-containing protein, partial [Armatimonadetes bacterium]|nr:PKD domain-containing protein [Anaerolineae bacterium]